jgi:hypothetical protein
MPAIRKFLLLGCALLVLSVTLSAQSVSVRHPEGLLRGFLVLKTLGGQLLADGDLIQNVSGDRVTSRLVFHFKDGSLHDETVVYSQRRQFQLISYHQIQKGPAFPAPLDMTIDGRSGQVTVRYTDDGKAKVETERMRLPANLANGLLPNLLKNVGSAPPASVGLVAATPKPRLVKLELSVAGLETFSTGGVSRKATHYVVKVDIGGISGFLAPIVGQQPPDSHVWILDGDAPAFIKAEQPFYVGGPLWRVELVSPVWPK